MTADFCCSCESRWRAIECMKQHYGHYPFPPPGTFDASSPAAAAATVAAWEPFTTRYMTRHDVLLSHSPLIQSKDSTLTVDRYTGAVTFTGDAWGWQDLNPYELDVDWWGHYLLDPGLYTVLDWNPAHVKLAFTFADVTFESTLGSPYALSDLDLDAGLLLDGFAMGDVGDHQVGGVANAGPFPTQLGSLRMTLHAGISAPYFDAWDVTPMGEASFASVVNWADISWWDLTPSGGLLKHIATGPTGTQPTIAAYAFWYPPDQGPQSSGFRFPSIVGAGFKFTSWLPISGKYTRTTWRRARTPGAVGRISDATQISMDGTLLHTLAPTFDPLDDIWITLTRG